eukprot:12901029-Alexandrium_andersonii.AAC.1
MAVVAEVVSLTGGVTADWSFSHRRWLANLMCGWRWGRRWIFLRVGFGDVASAGVAAGLFGAGLQCRGRCASWGTSAPCTSVWSAAVRSVLQMGSCG